jgi:hypothetical protein
VTSSDTITIPLILPFDEVQALAQLVKRIDYDTCARFAAVCWLYNGRSEGDVIVPCPNPTRRRIARHLLP